MPWSSSVRRRLRWAHWLALVRQVSLVSAKKISSASSCSLVSSRLALLSAKSLVLVALSIVCDCKVSCNASNSAFLVSINAAKVFAFFDSSAFDFSKSEAKVSYMPFRMPWICVDCGAYSPKGLLVICAALTPPRRPPMKSSGRSTKFFTASRSVLDTELATCGRVRTARTPATTLRSWASRVVSRKPFFAPAPESTLIAASSAPKHCSDSVFSSWYSSNSLLRTSSASRRLPAFSAMSFLSCSISEPCAAISLLTLTMKDSKASMFSFPFAMSPALRPNVSSHQQAYLS
mmetsp:Transcript_64284/g.162953  ORF Transcript_64284/g.162953 Transcript_64284/m.162953 type:complete len:290 (-) Transcript_64284:214-1083(-)